MDCWRNVHNLEHDNGILLGTWVAALPTDDSRHVLLVKGAGALESQELFVTFDSYQDAYNEAWRLYRDFVARVDTDIWNQITQNDCVPF